MICRLPSAINFFKLLEARPGLTAMLSEILSHAPVLAEALAQRTELLDGLIDATAFDPQPDVPELVRLFSVLEPGEDYQILLDRVRSEEHTSELQSLMRISYAVFCLKKKNTIDH